jgi:sugar lactone lactonase YvrE
MRKSFVAALGVVLSVGVTGCGDDAECPTGGTGTLQVNVTGLPGGTPAAIRLSGPGGERTATGTIRLENLPAGIWTASTEPVAVPGGIVRRAFDAPDGAQSCVRGGDTATLELAYAQIASSGRLWVGAQNSAGPLLAWAADALGVSGSTAPGVVINSKPQIPTGRGVAFDKVGNLWAADPSGTLKRFPASGLGQSGERVPDAIISSPSIGGGIPGPISLAFDGAGNLWVGVGAAKKVIRFTPDQLDQSGSPTPGVELTGLDTPDALAFDSAGNLWVASGGNRVRKVSVARLGTSTSGADLSIAATDVGMPTTILSGPTGLAFDGAGNLWVSYSGPNAIAKLAAGDLSGTGEKQVAPAVQLSLTVTALLDELVFDEEGALWTPVRNRELGRISPAQQTTTASITPTLVVTSSQLGAAHGLALYPAPANTPLYHRLP